MQLHTSATPLFRLNLAFKDPFQKKLFSLVKDPIEHNALALVDGREPVGLITRRKFLLKLVRRFGLEIYGKHPIITVAVTAPAGQVPVASDAVKLRQILMNLMSNAAKFTERGYIRLALSLPGDRMELSVSDSGIGIKPENLERLFTAFSQIEDAKTKQYEGTGLGLAISKSLVQALGGEISVTSIFGTGTAFTVSLPLDANRERGGVP